MSLILRKECQTPLDTYGLAEYHVRINDNKQLTIVGPCGKPLFSISGIIFSRVTPTLAEIEYAKELLQEFLIKFKQEILDVIKAKSDLFKVQSSMTELPDNFEKSYANSKYITYYSSNEMLRYYPKDNSFMYRIPDYTDISDIVLIYKVTKIKKQLKDLMTQWEVECNAEDKYSDALSILTTCTI